MDKRISIKSHVHELLMKNDGKVVWLSDLVEHVNMMNGGENVARKNTIQATMNFLIASGLPIEVVDRGNAWMYDSSKIKKGDKPTDKSRILFELIHETSNGTMLLSSDSGEDIFARRLNIE